MVYGLFRAPALDRETADIEPPYAEARVRAFLQLVLEELEKVRPWV